MHQDDDKLDLIYASNGERHDTAFEAWKMLRLVFDRNGASFLWFSELQFSISYVRCLEDRKYVTRLSTLVVLRKGASHLSNWVDAYMVLCRPCDDLPFLASLNRWEHDCDFKAQMPTARGPTFSGFQNIEMLAVSSVWAWFSLRVSS